MKKNKLIYFTSLILVVAIPLFISLYSLVLGKIPFWYDPARDLYLALGNHSKISLIGQTSGIPGIFYGPYWIWWLSIAMLFSKEPRVIAFFVLTIPYFTVFPFIIYKFRKIFGTLISILIFLLFTVSFNSYTVQIWNPHLAPLLCMVIIWLVVFEGKNKKFISFSKILLAGIFSGLLLNIHISFGLSVVVGVGLFLLISKDRLKLISNYMLGFLIIFIPFFIFEVRHGFNQINTVIQTITSSSSVVNETSQIDKLGIIFQFVNKLSITLHVPSVVGYILLLGGIIYLIFGYKKKIVNLNETEKRLLLLIAIISISMLTIYMMSKNPVWDYHFIGVEILVVLFIGIVVNKIKYLKYLLAVLVLVIIASQLSKIITERNDDPYKVSSLATKEHIVKTIYKDIGKEKFSIYIYSPGTFTPDFDYLLMIEQERQNNTYFNPNTRQKIVYLIVPATSPDIKADFIDNRTPNEIYGTVKTWYIADETELIKRQLK